MNHAPRLRLLSARVFSARVLSVPVTSWVLSLLFLIALSVQPVLGQVAGGPAATQPFAFVNVTVLPMDRPDDEGPGASAPRVLEGQTVVVVGGRIVAKGPVDAVAIPEGAIRLDGTGRFLMPGLAEMHAHVPPASGSDWPDRDALDEILFLYLANGITTMRGMLGAPYQLELRDAIARGDILGPRFIVGAPSFRNQDPDAAGALVRDNAAAGYDLQKIHPGANRESWDSMVAAARDMGLTFAGHVPLGVGLEYALSTGMSTVDHLDGYVEAVASSEVRARLAAMEPVSLADMVRSATPERIQAIAALTVATGVWQVPTLFLWENLRGAPDVDALMALPELRYVSPAQREQWRRTATNRQLPPVEVAEAHNRLRLEILRAIHEVGGRILMGSDAPQLFNVPGFALHREMERMEAAGMSRDAVLASGTRAVAEYVAEALGGTADFGVVAVGNRADLLLLEGNPLENLQHLQRRAGVMVAGRWISGEEIEARLARIAERYGAGTGG